jgi:hypothetical protein
MTPGVLKRHRGLNIGKDQRSSTQAPAPLTHRWCTPSSACTIHGCCEGVTVAVPALGTAYVFSAVLVCAAPHSTSIPLLPRVLTCPSRSRGCDARCCSHYQCPARSRGRDARCYINYQCPRSQELCESAEVKKAFLKELQAVGRAKGLKGFEEVKTLHLEPEPFSVENDMMTPSFKLKRNPLLKHYKAQVDAMYNAVRR